MINRLFRVDRDTYVRTSPRYCTLYPLSKADKEQMSSTQSSFFLEIIQE